MAAGRLDALQTYAVGMRIWFVPTRHMSPLDVVISPRVLPANMSLNVQRALVSIAVRVAIEKNGNFRLQTI